MRSETVPTPANPESPPLAPHDPPEPAPQAAAWRRALKVVGCMPARDADRSKSGKTSMRRLKWG
jgi:hypothetical protein